MRYEVEEVPNGSGRWAIHVELGTMGAAFADETWLGTFDEIHTQLYTKIHELLDAKGTPVPQAPAPARAAVAAPPAKTAAPARKAAPSPDAKRWSAVAASAEDIASAADDIRDAAVTANKPPAPASRKPSAKS